MDKFDAIIVGSGPAGMFCAYELILRNPKAKILIIEEGKALKDRKCPAQEHGTHCIKCKTCAITHGSSGAGAFSDGKLLLPHKGERTVRGNLGNHMNLAEATELYQYTDEIYLKFGATKKIHGKNGLSFIDTIKPYLNEANLKAKYSQIRHLGTDGAHKVYQNLETHLFNSGIETWFDTKVNDLVIKNHKITGVICQKADYLEKKVEASTVVLAIGRSGTKWLESMCRKHNIENYSSLADIGIRYELPDYVMQDINNNLYEGKFIGYPAPYNDKVRTFCQNPSGLVSSESYRGKLTLVNGHSLLEPSSTNTNLAILVSADFNGSENPINITENIAANINRIGKNQPIVQRLEDLKNGRKTTTRAINGNSVVPTLKTATPGDISLGMPHRIIIDILNFIKQMDIVAPGFAGDDNLIYAPEIKFYSLILKLKKNCETNISGLYGVGDGSGPTHGLMPASVNGVYLGRVLSKLVG